MAKLKLDSLTKSNIWTISEAELNQMLIDGKKKEGYAENETHYMNIIHTVFDIQYFDRDDEKAKERFEAEQYDLFYAPSDGEFNAVAIRKRKISKITDLTLENVSHLSPEDILSLIENNMGTGWQGLPLAIQDIIESAFYVDVATMPEAAIHRKGGVIDRRVADGYEVLEIARGTWVEAIFIKLKPKQEKPRFSLKGASYDNDGNVRDDDEEEDDDDSLDIDEKDDVTPNNESDDDDGDMEEQEPDIEDIDVIDDSEEDEE